MFGIETLDGSAQAAALIGAVLVEAIVLYVGYGTIVSLVGPSVTEAIANN